ARLALRCRFQQQPHRAAGDTEDCAESRAAAAAGPPRAGEENRRVTMADAANAVNPANPENPTSGPTAGSGREPLFRWTLSFLEPHRRRIALLAVLLLAEI